MTGHSSASSSRVLAGDIGGTSTRLALFDATGPADAPTLRRLAFERFSSRDHAGLLEIVEQFLRGRGDERGGPAAPPAAAAFGIAGPSVGGVVRTPNLPWVVDARQLGTAIGTSTVRLVNDLVANAWGILMLDESQMRLLGGPPSAPTNASAAVVSAGTGLGEAGIAWDGHRHLPIPSEGGHADLAPRDEEEWELLKHLQAHFGAAVSWERAVSGPGLVSIYQFLRDTGRGQERSDVAEAMRTGDPGAAITTAALESRCPMCIAALDRFASLYGAEAGNAALRYVARRGVYLGGGIAPRVLGVPGSEPFVARFMASFVDKGRMRPLLESIPVRVVLDDGAALLGAARLAAEAALENCS